MRLCFLLITFLQCFSGSGQVKKIPFKSLEGKAVYLPLKSKATVFIFLSPECPLCQGYSPTLKKLHREFSPKGIEFIGIVPGTDFSLQSILAFKSKYSIPIRILRDERNAAVKALHATVTPEVFVIGPDEKILYSGRIDNWAYEPGKKRKIITQHDLHHALLQISANEPVSISRTKPVGCFIE